MCAIAKTPEAPYYAAIFTSQRTDIDKGYDQTAKKMIEIAEKQTGFLGVESSRDTNVGITVSYWDSLEAINQWKNHAVHQIVQKKGKEEWYQAFAVRICKVERANNFEL
ncbi:MULTISPECIES: antibiotic biosynthesis monooxygenase family protein [Virgibacillus]|uniref:ABM domain-containing protein n=1 Tax=Virgibacillus massiliensis TaxID=1462526 RepID=A0A024Q7Z6_9BACI|nr:MULTISPECIES: antibiotic biosynthesis monooxygenase [Virgibacillus]EQB38458.1 hypothetical protein M948_07700 [Virgibacillus sp. CM-4]MYL41164.1 antibiotic biosynthesis monooxygenase [Virgibacillus massiliensis]CDQ38031.1 hypothetical protein BN990_00298 [Virgibacillus massiliensis]